MNSIPLRLCRPLAAAVLLLLLMPHAAAAEERPDFIPAAECGRCHVETYESWSRTFHALSAIDPVFVESYGRTAKRWDSGRARQCLTCHSPAASPGAGPADDPMAREGVTCSFCHSVTDVDHRGDGGRFTTSIRSLEKGFDEAGGPDHFPRSGLLKGSEFCAGCHQWTNPLGFAVLSTFSEWKAGGYADEGVTCQKCHMPESPGGDSAMEGAKTLRAANLHFQMGGHSQDQLSSAASLTAGHVVGPDVISVDAGVTNVRAGHRLPTGIPTRKMILVAELFDREGLLLASQSRVYGRTVVDRQGRVLEDVAEQFVLGAGELSDTRIAPRETRRERFDFGRPEGKGFVLLEVSLVYEIVTPYLSPPTLRFDIATKRIPISLEGPPGASPSSRPPLVLIALLFIAVTYIMVRMLFGNKGSRRADRERKE